jgi:hypothetical protein
MTAPPESSPLFQKLVALLTNGTGGSIAIAVGPIGVRAPLVVRVNLGSELH